METNPVDFAFGVPTDYAGCGGLTKREYFAAAAMQGYLASYPGDVLPTPKIVAEYSIKLSDALIEELNKQSK